MTARTSQSPPDAGFTIIELLVAVAIASLVLIGIGGLFAVGAQVRDRAADNAAVQSALIELQALLSLATSEVGLKAAAPADTGFALDVVAERRVELEGWSVALQRPPSGPRVELQRGASTSSVDLTAYDAAALEYLVVSSDTPSWVSAVEVAGAEIRAVRLRLELGARVWRPLIWIPQSLALQAP